MSWRQRHRIAAWSFALLWCAVAASCSKQSDDEASTARVKTKDISFGRRQVDQMLADRPEMVGILGDDDPIVLWIIDGMNGGRIGQRVYWNANSPRSGSFAEHGAPYAFYPPYISLTGGTEATGVDKWTGIVYELFNLENSGKFANLYSQAVAGTLDGDAYAEECAELEYDALKKAETFFREHPLPKAKPRVDKHYDQIRRVPATFEEYLARHSEASGGLSHPGVYFKKYYDDAVAPYIAEKRKAEAADE